MVHKTPIDLLIDLSDSLKTIDNPYIKIMLIADSIEFLGKCVNNSKKWKESKKSKKNFELALKEFKSLNYYRKYKDLYSNLRCSLVHCFVPDGYLRIKDKGENTTDTISLSLIHI